MDSNGVAGSGKNPLPARPDQLIYRTAWNTIHRWISTQYRNCWRCCGTAQKSVLRNELYWPVWL